MEEFCVAEKDRDNYPLNYTKLREQVKEQLDKSNPSDAYLLLRDVLEYPGKIDDDLVWRDAFGLLEQITRDLDEIELATLVKKIIGNPNDVDALFDLSYELYEQNLYGVAATLLKKANEISPQDSKIVTELVSNLEALFLNNEAYKVLTQSKKLVESDEFCRYLLAFNALMIGNIDEPGKILPSIKNSKDKDIQFMANSLNGMLGRALIFKENRSLDDKDLRGWHMVLNSSILLHLSPFGLDDGMNGRYSYISDSYSLIRHGIDRLKAVIDISNINVPSVLALPDRSSRILALATSRILGIPFKDWNNIDITTPGLIVAYDLDESNSGEILKEIADHRPGQILWAHASNWINPFPFAPDITTYLYQHNTNPWSGGGMGYNIKSQKVTVTEPDQSDDEEISKRIIGATVDEEYIDDLDDLLSIISICESLEDENRPGIFKKAGRRIRQKYGSPVQSNSFL